MPYEHQITIGNEVIYFTLETDPEEVLSNRDFSWSEWYEHNDPRDID